jgi:hypothetical protein
LIALYSGELYHTLALAMLSNSMTTMPIGDQVPSATSTLVPPPHNLTSVLRQRGAGGLLVGGEFFRVTHA